MVIGINTNDHPKHKTNICGPIDNNPASSSKFNTTDVIIDRTIQNIVIRTGGKEYHTGSQRLKADQSKRLGDIAKQTSNKPIPKIMTISNANPF
jgi:hypothetical protein